ncbi:MAG: RusA family crossover junction endodeoxyribonuclease [Sulfuricurvum sp.]|nr:RusA family crossover junction endodeoxyribonuclease [Sulfuricurvum sp.]
MIYLELFIPVIPIAKGRPKFFRRGNFVGTYTPTRTRSYEAEIKDIIERHMLQNNIKTAIGPLSMSLVFYFPRPKSHTKKMRMCMHHTVAPDVDNLCKSAFDALNGIVFADDKQICMLAAAKRYCQDTQRPGVMLRLEKLK